MNLRFQEIKWFGEVLIDFEGWNWPWASVYSTCGISKVKGVFTGTDSRQTLNVHNCWLNSAPLE